MIVNEGMDREIGEHLDYKVHQKDLTEQGPVKEELKAGVGWRFTGDSDPKPALRKVHAANSQTLRAEDCAQYRKIGMAVHLDMYNAAKEGNHSRNQRDEDGDDFKTVGAKNEYTNIQNTAAMLRNFRAPNAKSFGEDVGLVINTHAGGLNFEMGLLNYLQDTLNVEKIDGKAMLASIGYETNAAKLRESIEIFTEHCSAKGFGVKIKEDTFDQSRVRTRVNPEDHKELENLKARHEDEIEALADLKDLLERLKKRQQELQAKQLIAFQQLWKQQKDYKDKQGKEKGKEIKTNKQNPPPPLKTDPPSQKPKGQLQEGKSEGKGAAKHDTPSWPYQFRRDHLSLPESCGRVRSQDF